MPMGARGPPPVAERLCGSELLSRAAVGGAISAMACRAATSQNVSGARRYALRNRVRTAAAHALSGDPVPQDYSVAIAGAFLGECRGQLTCNLLGRLRPFNTHHRFLANMR